MITSTRRGRAAGPARVVRGVEDLGEVRQGEVIVAAATDPSWTAALSLGRALVLEVGGLDSRFDTVQDFELGLRLSERARSIAHVGQPLYRWRSSTRSITRRRPNRSVIENRQALAVPSRPDVHVRCGRRLEPCDGAGPIGQSDLAQPG